jgi:hypothetical protein
MNMHSEKIAHLTRQAQARMKDSRDPIHDLDHVTRVVAHVHTLSRELKLNSEQVQALELAAWWHDVSRTITRGTSIVIMPFIDDILSALMLWFATIRLGLFGSVAGMATRMIVCKSIGTGRIFTRLLMRKKNRGMIDILHDADMLDVLSIERQKHVHRLADSSWVYRQGYRLSIWWFLQAQSLRVKTNAAKKYLVQMVRSFIVWVKRKEVYFWHVERYGIAWVKKYVRIGEKLLQDLSPSST